MIKKSALRRSYVEKLRSQFEKAKTIYIFYHRVDWDGVGSAALVCWFIEHTFPKDVRVQLIGVNHGEPMPKVSFEESSITFVVDFCFSLEQMRELSKATTLFWFDHHITSIERMSEHPDIEWYGVADVSVSAAFLVQNLYLSTETLRFAQLVSDYDCHKPIQPPFWQQDEAPFLFNVGLGVVWRSKDISSFGKYLRSPVRKIFKGELSIESVILAGQKRSKDWYQQDVDFLSSRAFMTTFQGRRCLAANASGLTLQKFKGTVEQLEEPVDALIWFFLESSEIGTRWVVNLRSLDPEFDVSVEAKRFGGGGHRGAAGFCCRSLPFSVGTGCAVAAEE